MADIKILVADKLSQVGIDWLKQQEDVEVDHIPGKSPAELAEIAPQYDGMIIRSGVKVTAEVLENPGRLKEIGKSVV
jgi:D-3-phosphoglycerate dehydrogenase / 2-oxoglutarate reductase